MPGLSVSATVWFISLALLLTLMAANNVMSQSLRTDLALVRLASDIPVTGESGIDHRFQRINDDDAVERSRPPRLLGRNVLERFNPVSLVMAGSLYGYQNAISPQLSNRCIYHPSCSAFSREIISERGLIPGVFLTADRISRCNRISAMDAPQHRFEFRLGRIIDETERYHK